jgi:hypothetical protein
MNRPLLLPLFLCFSLPLSLYSLEQTVLVPVEVYVGDRARIRHTFSAGKGGWPALEPGKPLELPPEKAVFAALEPDCTVTAASLTFQGVECLLTVDFIPWKTGELDIPPFDLRELVDMDSEAALMVDIAPVMIASLSQKLGEIQLRPPAPPLIVPGTTYALLGIAALAAAALAGAAVSLARARRSGRTLSALFGSLFFSKAGRRAFKQLKALKKKYASPGSLSSPGAGELAGGLQVILRGYLDAHFGWPFRAASSPELFPAIADITGGMMDGARFAQVEKLEALFRRCDFIRFAGNAALEPGEPLCLAGDARSRILFFERGGEPC